MGNEATVQARLGGEAVEVRAHLDGEMLQLSGGARRLLRLRDVRRATSRGEWLELETEAGEIGLLLGERQAALWARKITSPPSLADKLGLKPELAIRLVGVVPPEILGALQAAKLLPRSTGGASAAVKGKEPELIFLALDSAARLPVLAQFLPSRSAGSALWLIYRKGAEGPGGSNVILAARAFGLRDTKVVKISETHTGLRFVWPRT